MAFIIWVPPLPPGRPVGGDTAPCPFPLYHLRNCKYRHKLSEASLKLILHIMDTSTSSVMVNTKLQIKITLLQNFPNTLP